MDSLAWVSANRPNWTKPASLSTVFSEIERNWQPLPSVAELNWSFCQKSWKISNPCAQAQYVYIHYCGRLHSWMSHVTWVSHGTRVTVNRQCHTNELENYRFYSIATKKQFFLATVRDAALQRNLSRRGWLWRAKQVNYMSTATTLQGLQCCRDFAEVIGEALNQLTGWIAQSETLYQVRRWQDLM